MISFSWDDKKNEANKKKHWVSFDEARTVFYDENAIRYFDPDHSGNEDRFLMVKKTIIGEIDHEKRIRFK
jgi:uncharacterized DUF497 family protein